MIGKIWTNRFIGKNLVESTMVKIWRLSKLATFREVRPNVFSITFANHANKSCVVDGRPLFFDNNFFVINYFDGFIQLSIMKCDKTTLWVQFHNMPLVGMNRKCGEKLESSLG